MIRMKVQDLTGSSSKTSFCEETAKRAKETLMALRSADQSGGVVIGWQATSSKTASTSTYSFA